MDERADALLSGSMELASVSEQLAAASAASQDRPRPSQRPLAGRDRHPVGARRLRGAVRHRRHLPVRGQRLPGVR
ncbi:MAG: hypothetical protein R2705_20790 [Ilumatobacteraceae bacterium]